MTKKKTPQTIEECNAELERTQKKIRQYENRSKITEYIRKSSMGLSDFLYSSFQIYTH